LKFSLEEHRKSGLLYPASTWGFSFSLRELVGEEHQQGRKNGEGIGSNFDKKTLARFQDINELDEAKRNTLFDLIDTYIRDAKVRSAHK